MSKNDIMFRYYSKEADARVYEQLNMREDGEKGQERLHDIRGLAMALQLIIEDDFNSIEKMRIVSDIAAQIIELAGQA
jgi:hypothetical protein